MLTFTSVGNKNKPVEVDLRSLKKTIQIHKAINHSLRQKMLYLIDEAQPVSVKDIYIHLRLDQSKTSLHLAVLRKAGFIKASRKGKYVYYSLNSQRIEDLNGSIKSFGI